jgi:hypothetical protein
VLLCLFAAGTYAHGCFGTKREDRDEEKGEPVPGDASSE